MKSLYTIGYEGTKISPFVDRLREFDIELLLDVRELPLSRKQGFSKTVLSRTLIDNSISYRHLRALGDPKPGRDAARRGDHALFLSIFHAHMQGGDAQKALKQAIALSKLQRTCLLCFERDASGCHRKIVADTMAEVGSFLVEHIRIN